MLKIDKNIPIPPKRKENYHRGKRKYPFLEMQVGDSFFVECQQTPRARDHKIIQVNNVFRRYKKRHNLQIKITTRSVPEGIRVWRINNDST